MSSLMKIGYCAEDYRDCLGEVAHHSKAERIFSLRTQQNFRLRKEAAARCTAKTKRKVLKKQARKARAEHLVKCCLEPGETADRTVRKRTLHRRQRRVATRIAEAL